MELRYSTCATRSRGVCMCLHVRGVCEREACRCVCARGLRVRKVCVREMCMQVSE